MRGSGPGTVPGRSKNLFPGSQVRAQAGSAASVGSPAAAAPTSLVSAAQTLGSSHSGEIAGFPRVLGKSMSPELRRRNHGPALSGRGIPLAPPTSRRPSRACASGRPRILGPLPRALLPLPPSARLRSALLRSAELRRLCSICTARCSGADRHEAAGPRAAGRPLLQLRGRRRAAASAPGKEPLRARTAAERPAEGPGGFSAALLCSAQDVPGMQWGGAGRRPVLGEPRPSPAAPFEPAPGSRFPPPARMLTYTLFGFGTGPCTPSLGPHNLIPGLARVPASRRPGGGRRRGREGGPSHQAAPFERLRSARPTMWWPSAGTWMVIWSSSGRANPLA